MCSEGRKGVASTNHDEHETFLPGLQKFDEFVETFRDGEGEGGKIQYNGNDLKAIIEDFGPKLALHLKNEIVLLESLADDEKIDWGELGRAMAGHSKKVADRVCRVFVHPFLDPYGRYVV